MKKVELKKEVNKAFGFAVNKITLLEYSADKYVATYIMFDCCGIEYQMRRNNMFDWVLHVYNHHNFMDNVITY